LLKELIPVSQNLAALWAAGLQALNYIDRGERASESGRTIGARPITPQLRTLENIMKQIFNSSSNTSNQ
jgi:hypothetical protein